MYLCLGLNHNLTPEDLEEHIDYKYWDWELLSKHRNMTWDFISETMKNPDYKWNMKYVSRNPNITWDIIAENSKLDWDWECVFEQIYISTDIIKIRSAARP